jgi:hypothetical protein
MSRKTWNEQLNNKKPSEIIKLTPEEAVKHGFATLLIANPLEYDAVMKTIPQGRLVTADRINAYLAKKHNAGSACPLCGGIFINLVAKASEERKGESETPYWRTLRKGGELNEKFPGGLDGHKVFLEMEGHKVIQKGKRYFVTDYESKLFDLK